MDQLLINTVFQPKPSKQEAKADATTRVVRAIVDNEASARDAKSARLRAARLAQEATAKPAPETGKKVLRKR